MLRRVARTLRGIFLVVGIGATLFTGITAFVQLSVISDWPPRKTSVMVGFGRAEVSWLQTAPDDLPLDPPGVNLTCHSFALNPGWLPTLRRFDQPSIPYKSMVFSVPFWLLAAVCLPWPVTSFLVRRRRRGRGFEVEARGAVPTADS
jgi:hypothetical protein